MIYAERGLSGSSLGACPPEIALVQSAAKQIPSVLFDSWGATIAGRLNVAAVLPILLADPLSSTMLASEMVLYTAGLILRGNCSIPGVLQEQGRQMNTLLATIYPLLPFDLRPAVDTAMSALRGNVDPRSLCLAFNSAKNYVDGGALLPTIPCPPSVAKTTAVKTASATPLQQQPLPKKPLPSSWSDVPDHLRQGYTMTKKSTTPAIVGGAVAAGAAGFFAAGPIGLVVGAVSGAVIGNILGKD